MMFSVPRLKGVFFLVSFPVLVLLLLRLLICLGDWLQIEFTLFGRLSQILGHKHSVLLRMVDNLLFDRVGPEFEHISENHRFVLVVKVQVFLKQLRLILRPLLLFQDSGCNEWCHEVEKKASEYQVNTRWFTSSDLLLSLLRMACTYFYQAVFASPISLFLSQLTRKPRYFILAFTSTPAMWSPTYTPTLSPITWVLALLNWTPRGCSFSSSPISCSSEQF